MAIRKSSTETIVMHVNLAAPCYPMYLGVKYKEKRENWKRCSCCALLPHSHVRHTSSDFILMMELQWKVNPKTLHAKNTYAKAT